MIYDINLLPPSERKSSVSKIFIAVIAIVWAVLFALVIFNYLSAQKEIDELHQSELKLRTEVAAAQNQSKIDTDTSTHEKAVVYADSLTVETSKLIHYLAELLPANAYLTEYEIVEEVLIIRNQFETMNDLTSYVTQLTSSNNFTDVKVDSVETYVPVEDDTSDLAFDEIPRYQSAMSLIVNKQSLLNEEE